MRPSRARAHHPLTAAGSALEHLLLRHFGFELIRTDVKQSPRRPRRRSDGRVEQHAHSHDGPTI